MKRMQTLKKALICIMVSASILSAVPAYAGSNSENISVSETTVTSESKTTNKETKTEKTVKNGLVRKNGKLYYYVNGQKFCKGYKKINGKRYYFRSNGQAATNMTVEFVYGRNSKKYCMVCNSKGEGTFVNSNGYGKAKNDRVAQILRNYYQETAKGVLKRTSVKTDYTTLYHQRQWGTVSGGISMVVDGCGPTAIAMALSGYESGTTPADVANYLYEEGYLYKNNGTTRYGITAGLENYGFKVLNYITPEGSGGSTYNRAFNLFRKYLKQGRNVDMVFIAYKTNNNSLHPLTYWTKCGHFLVISNYRKGSDGKYYYYVNDPGYQKHTGWYTADDLRYYVNVFWIAEYTK